MRKWWTLLLLFLLVMVFVAQTPQPQEKPLFVPGELVVKLKPEAAPTVDALAAGLNLEKKASLSVANYFVLKAGEDQDLKQLAESLKGNPDVEFAEPNYIYHAFGLPNDPQFSQLWGMHNTGQTGGTADADIDAVEAWDVTTGSADVLVGIIDTGVDYKHPDLAANMWANPNEDAWSDPNNPRTGNGIDDDNNGYIDDWRGWDFANNDNDPFDDNGHGTHVSGTIGAVGNNGAGVAGVNWHVRIMPLKFLRADGSGTLAAAIEAINYASQFGVHITNNSWGGGSRSTLLEQAIQQANNAGSLFVAAAGNNGTDNDLTPNYPSNYEVPNVLAVAAIDDKGNLASFGSGGGGGGICGCNGSVLPTPGSNYGATTVDVAAPGKNILSTTPNNTYSSFSGTSMATPHVAGVAALVLSKFPALTNVQLKQSLMNAVDVSAALQGKIVTGGRINAHMAVTTAPTPMP